LGPLRGTGSRAYLAVRGGIDVPPYLGSRAPFTLGLFGGHSGRALQPGDVLHVGEQPPAGAAAVMSSALIPHLTENWEIAALAGPHGAPDFITVDDMRNLFSSAWKVHDKSSRTGVRLLGPKPRWART